MKHISEDNLLQYALEIIESDQEREGIEIHLKDCPTCRNLLNKLLEDINVIGSVSPRVQSKTMPNQKRTFIKRYAFLKVAALFLFGLFVGLGISGRTDQEIVFISPAYINQSPPADSLLGYAVPDATGISYGNFEDNE